MTARKSPDSAVILAAGLGLRLRSLHSELPKGLIELGGISPVPRAINLLLAEGVKDIVLVTGWRAAAYETLVAEKFPVVRCVHNPYFETSGSMYSLSVASEMVAGDFLLLESDLLYEPRALAALRAAPRGDYVLLSGTTGQGDEVYAFPSSEGRLDTLSKQVRKDACPSGEFTGISRVTAELHRKLCTHFESIGGIRAGNYHYEDAFTALAATHPINLLTIEDLVWCEIDDPAHYARALARVLPALKKISHGDTA